MTFNLSTIQPFLFLGVNRLNLLALSSEADTSDHLARAIVLLHDWVEFMNKLLEHG